MDAAEKILQINRLFTFLIADEGPEHNKLTEEIDRRGLSSYVKLTGHVDDISRIYSIADIFVSASNWEGLPNTYLEALRFQIPMIITNTPGIDYLKSGIT